MDLMIGFLIMLATLIFIAFAMDKDVKRRRNEMSSFLDSIPHDEAIVIGSSFYAIAFNDTGRKLYIIADDSKQTWRKVDAYITDIVDYDSIDRVDIDEDGYTVQKIGRPNIGGAIIGRAVAGSAGMVLGGLPREIREQKMVKSVKVVIMCKDGSCASIECFQHTGSGGLKPEDNARHYKWAMGNAQKILTAVSKRL